ncbi:sodium/pantothenate symporter [Vibrio gazogenes]|uniref:Sodium/pantothenate symporter n=1 Tax=Vibrio gazogenes DSM 21264 = NBRC 103151 TaxID=1123492 RepID=A0A1M5EY25_VIBGA|nr:sodium/pantothenate symporter [Vibrio gazogenes]USP14775.1 sodium/pantothenate symporter [Vibrio gazogenes]SHF84098.1 sodium/pantothenate symporter [Vibrio gazogenes DSM 21264] [Vibrio gazogenes DSM 21264 = NBRC 103151]SJN55152.1 Sodium/pantothenate symporter [Vibrio gazogenes]
MNSQLIIPLLIYLAAVFALAMLTRRHHRPGQFLSEYFIGSRSLGGFVLAMTLAATYASASSFIGGPGAAYKMGLGWVLLAMIQLPATWLTLGVLGKKFAMEARRHNAVTLNDILFARFQSRTVVIITSLTLLLAFFGTMVVQFVGGARLLQTVTGLSYHQGLLLFACTVGLYTTIGGFRAVVLTDTVQGIMMLIGTFVLLWGVIHAGHGIGELITRLHDIDPALVTPYGPDHFLNQPFILSFWVLVCFGVIGLPHAAVRCMSYKDSASLHKGIVISTIMMALLMFGTHLAGALGRAIVPEVASPDQIMPTLMMTVLPPMVAGIFLAGPMAAIMSTIDSQLIQASATLLKDLYLNYINPRMLDEDQGERKLSRLSVWVTAIFALLVFLAATHPPDMIIWLNLMALGGLQAVFLWPLVLGLYWSKASATGALSSMAVGLASYISLVAFKPDLGGIHPIVPTLILGLVAFIVGSYLKPSTASTVMAAE